MAEQERETFEGFAIVELMGRNVIAGYCSQQVIGGAMLRIDVPAVEQEPAYTKFFAPSAIYAITPTDEATCMTAAERLRQRPIDQWIVPQPRQLTDSAPSFSYRHEDWAQGSDLDDARVEDGDDEEEVSGEEDKAPHIPF